MVRLLFAIFGSIPGSHHASTPSRKARPISSSVDDFAVARATLIIGRVETYLSSQEFALTLSACLVQAIHVPKVSTNTFRGEHGPGSAKSLTTYCTSWALSIYKQNMTILVKLNAD